MQIAERLTLINDYALGAVGGGGSLAGYQPKTTLALLDGVWHAGVDGAASTHILGAGSDDRETLLAHTAFNTAIGNTDAHAKNFSTVRSSNGAVTLAPLYDVSTHALAPNGQLNMSLRINSRAYQPSLTVEDLVTEGISWGLEERHARLAVTGMLEELEHALEQADASAVGEKVARYIGHGTRNLLDGRAAGVGGAHPSFVELGPLPGST